jgi:anti-sigma B factor antagonist
MSDQLRIETESGERHGRRILRLTGRVSLETVPEFLKALRAEKSTVVILDFSQVSSIDSAGVGSLIQLHVAFQKNGQILALAAISTRVEAVLDVAHVKKVFRTFLSVEAAEEALG